jgi:hypothetical protein
MYNPSVKSKQRYPDTVSLDMEFLLWLEGSVKWYSTVLWRTSTEVYLYSFSKRASFTACYVYHVCEYACAHIV